MKNSERFPTFCSSHMEKRWTKLTISSPGHHEGAFPTHPFEWKFLAARIGSISWRKWVWRPHWPSDDLPQERQFHLRPYFVSRCIRAGFVTQSHSGRDSRALSDSWAPRLSPNFQTSMHVLHTKPCKAIHTWWTYFGRRLLSRDSLSTLLEFNCLGEMKIYAGHTTLL